MPHLSLPLDAVDGCVVPVTIGVSALRSVALRSAGLSVAPAIRCRALIDTGASCTSLDKSVIDELTLPPRGNTLVHSASTAGLPTMCNTYDVAFSVVHQLTPFVRNNLPVVEIPLTGFNFKVLIGRDLLAFCTYFYDGAAKRFTLSY